MGVARIYGPHKSEMGKWKWKWTCACAKAQLGTWPAVSYLMQLSGSLSQSVLHMNLSQCSQPMVGVRASPLSRASVLRAASRDKNTTTPFMFHPRDVCSPSKQNASAFWTRPLGEWRQSGPMRSEYGCFPALQSQDEYQDIILAPHFGLFSWCWLWSQALCSAAVII